MSGVIRGSALLASAPSVSVPSRHEQKLFARPTQDSDDAFENLKKELDELQDPTTDGTRQGG